MKYIRAFSPSVFLSLWLAFATPGWAQTVTLKPANASNIYNVGDKVTWDVTFNGTFAAPVNYTLKKNGLTVFQQGTLDPASGNGRIETTLDEPAAILLEVQNPSGANAAGGRRGGAGGGRVLAGALVAPEKLQPSSPRPADFDAWWDAKIKQLHEIPINANVTAGESGKTGVDYFQVQLDNINGTHVDGQLAKPAKEGKFPALLILQWAGTYPLQKQWVTDRAAEGWLAFNIEPHDLPIDQPAAFYTNEPSVRNYQAIGQDDREKSYFLRMYLSAYRALDYLAERPDWDGKTLVVMGTSMGGQQSISLAGLHPKVTALIVMVPSSCDMTGPEHGRAAGFPDWARDAQTKKNPAILETGRYFDPVNFASRIKVPALVAMGLFDETSPPAGVWSAINQMHGPVEPLPMVSGHQNQNGGQAVYTARSAEWLGTLVKGEALAPKTISPAPSMPGFPSPAK